MKKVLSVILALTLFTSLAVLSAVTFCADEVGETYEITCEVIGGYGEVSVSADVVAAGDTVTFTVESNRPFIEWSFVGDYEIVSGSLTDTVISILPKSDIDAYAEFKEEDEEEDDPDFPFSEETLAHYYVISCSAEGPGTAAADKDKVSAGSDEKVTLTATEDGGVFSKWEMTGSYDIVSGDENSKVLTIIPKSDVIVKAVFSKKGSEPTENPSENPSGKPTDNKGDKPVGNRSDKSPKTSDPTQAVIVLVLLAGFAGAVAIRKVKE